MNIVFLYILLGLGWLLAVTMCSLLAFKLYPVKSTGNCGTPVEGRLGKSKVVTPTTSSHKKYFVGLLCIGKNEEMIIRDFIQHYIEQGVEHIYAIDNGSTDNTAAILKTYVSTGYVSYYYMPEIGKQEQHYNAVFKSNIQDECEWIMVNDFDEYVFGVHKPLREYLENDLSSHDYLQFRMINYGSSGHIKHPKDVRCSFIHRYPEDHTYESDNRKGMVRCSKVRKLRVHSHVLKRGVGIYEVPNTVLRMNHYISMSKEYWETVKMTRGDSFYGNRLQRTMDIFDKYNNYATVEDGSLRDLVLHGYV